MFLWCCASTNHPADWFCSNFYVRPSCNGKGPSVPDDDPIQPSPPWLRAFEEELEQRGQPPTEQELLTLIHGLQAYDFVEDAMRLAEQMENTLPANSLETLSLIHQTKAGLFDKLGRPEDAIISLNVARSLTTAARYRRTIGTR